MASAISSPYRTDVDQPPKTASWSMGRNCVVLKTVWFWLIGLVLLGLSLFYFHSVASIVIIVLVLFWAYPRIKETFFGQTSPAMQNYYNTHISNRLSMALMYLGLIAALLLGYWDASSHLSHLMANS